MSKSPNEAPQVQGVEGFGVGPSSRRLAFARIYLANGRKGQPAARAVGCAESGSDSTARRWLKDPEVRALIAKADEQLTKSANALSDKLALTAENLDRETALIAFRDPKNLCGPDGRMLPPDQLPEEIRRIIRSVKVTTSKEGELFYSYTFEPKTETLALGYRRLGLLKDKVEVELKSHAELVLAAFETAREVQGTRVDVLGALPESVVTESDDTVVEKEEQGGGVVGGRPKSTGRGRKTGGPGREPWEK